MWSTPELPDPSFRRDHHQQQLHHSAVAMAQEEQQPHTEGAVAEGTKASMMMLQHGQAAAAGNGSGDYAREIAESLRFQEEIQSLMRETLLESQVVHGPVPAGVLSTPQPPTSSSSPSFTALLGLPTSQAMELLHDPGVPSHATSATLPLPLTAVDFPFSGISPTFPSNAALVERAARYSVFAASVAAAAGNAEGSTESSSQQPSNSGGSARAVKPEPADSDSRSENKMALSPSPPPVPQQRGGKRKEPEKNKGKPGNGGKKSKGTGEDGATKVEAVDKQQLPYVHVRARRGQATDSHSLAERARREKINARMKLLQELVPGCSKISGTALVLDEIINHVQCLQRQVEMLSMRLAAVNPRIDFCGLDSFLTTEQPVRVPGSAVGMDAAAAAAPPPAMWAEVPVDGLGSRLRHHQQIWQGDSAGPHPSPSVLWSGDSSHQQLYLHHHHHHGGLIGPGTSLFGYDSASAVPMHASQLKTEL